MFVRTMQLWVELNISQTFSAIARLLILPLLLILVLIVVPPGAHNDC